VLASSSDVLHASYDVGIVGAGPAGIACALRCHSKGLRTLLVEAGGDRPVPGHPDILAADIAEPRWHNPPRITSAAALGGTSHWWGGRSVPLDPVDFRDWPIGYEDLLPWYEAAAEFFGAGGVHASPAPGAFAELAHFDATRDETWCPQINMAKRWRAALHAGDGLAVVTNARVTGLECANGVATGLRIRAFDAEHLTAARHIVLAGGGLGSLRLLLLAQRETPALFGGPDGPLGVGYMGHLTGTIADFAPRQPEDADAFAFRPLGDGIFARRRITARESAVVGGGTPNIAFWIDNAYSRNPTNGTSAASAKQIVARLAHHIAAFGHHRDDAAISPSLDHIAKAPISAAVGLSRALSRLAWARITGRPPRSRRFVPASPGAWLMRYHAEQHAHPGNSVRLSAASVDSIGLPRLDISFRFNAEDCEAVVRAHELLDLDMQSAGAGRLRWHGSREQSLAMVTVFARDGFHQLGGARMSADPKLGIVDGECRTHDIRNLWVASSCVFPTGGQANPTLTIVALACRIAETLATQPPLAVGRTKAASGRRQAAMQSKQSRRVGYSTRR
jgi:choline dehydrogenase-like flavoprotein